MSVSKRTRLEYSRVGVAAKASRARGGEETWGEHRPSSCSSKGGKCDEIGDLSHCAGRCRSSGCVESRTLVRRLVRQVSGAARTALR
jgi:hypothetical protein